MTQDESEKWNQAEGKGRGAPGGEGRADEAGPVAC